MHVTETRIRVRYAETDRMGFVYYGNYATYFEVARVDAMRSLGFTYRQLEDDGILMPVHTYEVVFLKPAHYDDELLIRTVVSEVPAARITFDYETYNSAGDLLNRAKTTLVFLARAGGKPLRAPAAMAEALRRLIAV